MLTDVDAARSFDLTSENNIDVDVGGDPYRDFFFRFLVQAQICQGVLRIDIVAEIEKSITT